MAVEMKHCCTFDGGDTPVMLHQYPAGAFVVTYGKQMKTQLSYGEAACEFGACIMHSLACASMIETHN